MTSKEFTVKCKPYNRKYRDLFNVVPCPQDFAGTQDEFFGALLKSIETQRPIDEFLRKKTIPHGNDIKI